MIPECCDIPMQCIENGVPMNFDELLYEDSRSYLFYVEVGNSDLYKCAMCDSHAVDGFNILISRRERLRLKHD
jgi:hypothetical protein